MNWKKALYSGSSLIESRREVYREFLSWLEFDGLRKSISPVLLYDEPLSTIKDF
jgi:hypothetical protein